MAKLAVLDKTGKKVSDIELKDEIFAIEPNKSAMHLVVVNYLANQRQGTQSTLTRSESPAAAKSPGSRRHRPRKTGLNESSAVDSRRYCTRPEAA